MTEIGLAPRNPTPLISRKPVLSVKKDQLLTGHKALSHSGIVLTQGSHGRQLLKMQAHL
ncbi:rCG45764 [Rattus norvegicus]|uniref:RCG45764 n=1 Tax=Rattus norvegicus TaxID=10116 RepID=A6JTM3_RAT|nr:rCG45764 [Rattus norvegicus]